MPKNIIEKYKTLRILILEDLPADAELMVRELEANGFVVEAKLVDDEVGFRNGISEFRPEIILSDYSLPTITGLEALSIAVQECPEIPFIFITGTIGEEIAAETILSGAAGLVLKEKLNHLPQTVRNVFKEEGRWLHIKLKNANERINKRIEKNQKALDRLDEFLKNRRTAQLSNEIIEDIKKMIEDLKNISNDLTDDKKEKQK